MKHVSELNRVISQLKSLELKWLSHKSRIWDMGISSFVSTKKKQKKTGNNLQYQWFG